VSALGERVSAMSFALRALDHLEEIRLTLGRLLELQQGPRLNFLAAGSVAGGGVAGTAAQAIIAAQPRRRGLYIQNNAASGGGTLTVGLGVTSPIAGQGIVLAPGQAWQGLVSGLLWPGSVSVIASQAGTAYSWLTITGPSSRVQNEAL
jgi:hypothetical protein